MPVETRDINGPIRGVRNLDREDTVSCRLELDELKQSIEKSYNFKGLALHGKISSALQGFIARVGIAGEEPLEALGLDKRSMMHDVTNCFVSGRYETAVKALAVSLGSADDNTRRIAGEYMALLPSLITSTHNPNARGQEKKNRFQGAYKIENEIISSLFFEKKLPEIELPITVSPPPKRIIRNGLQKRLTTAIDAPREETSPVTETSPQSLIEALKGLNDVLVSAGVKFGVGDVFTRFVENYRMDEVTPEAFAEAIKQGGAGDFANAMRSAMATLSTGRLAAGVKVALSDHAKPIAEALMGVAKSMDAEGLGPDVAKALESGRTSVLRAAQTVNRALNGRAGR